MSLATFKKKSINKASSATKKSGKQPGGIWLPQGPFGKSNTLTSVMLEDVKTYYGPKGFSINGPYRNKATNRELKFSSQGTRYRGPYAYGSGGHLGRYYVAEPLLNAGKGKIEIRGNQWEYIKQSSLSTKGMLEKRYRWINNGTYPNNWVQLLYSGNQTDSASQGLYVHNKSSKYDCVVDTNDISKYSNYFKYCGANGCQNTPARGYIMNIQQANAPYTKSLHIPQTSSQHTLRIQRQCVNPKPNQKHFPYSVQTGTGILTGGINVSSVGNACNTSNNYLAPPLWYVSNPYPQLPKPDANTQAQINQTINNENWLAILNGTTNVTN